MRSLDAIVNDLPLDDWERRRVRTRVRAHLLQGRRRGPEQIRSWRAALLALAAMLPVLGACLLPRLIAMIPTNPGPVAIGVTGLVACAIIGIVLQVMRHRRQRRFRNALAAVLSEYGYVWCHRCDYPVGAEAPFCPECGSEFRIVASDA